MTALTALASATIVAPEESVPPPQLEACVRHACAGAWRALEVVLAGDVLRGRLGKTRDTYVRDGVDAVLGLFGNVAVRPEPLAELRAARQAGALDGALNLTAITARVRDEAAAAVGKTAIESVRRALAAYPALDAVLGESEPAALLVDAARALFRRFARAPELARWAIGPTGIAARDRALAAFAELIGSPASVDELEVLIALPIHLDENVQFTVYRPRSIDAGRWHAMLAFAHLAERRLDDDTAPDPVEEVRRQAESMLGDRAAAYQPVTQDAGAAIPAEGELTFVPEIAGIEFNPPRRSFLWLEAVHREEFRMRAGRELDGKTVRGRLSVFLGHIVIAEVPLSVRVDDKRPEPTVREPARARAYRRIFASYSHKDVAIVNQFETYARALGDEYLRDWIHLRTGEVWNDRLRQLIEQADAFQLFWSWNSMHSKFVKQEYEHALALNRPSFVRPTYWEEPMPTAPGLPPEALLRLHFQKIGGAAIAPAAAAAPAAAHAPSPSAPRPAPGPGSSLGPASSSPPAASSRSPARPGGTMPPPRQIPVLAIPVGRDTQPDMQAVDSQSEATLEREIAPTSPRELQARQEPTKRARSASGTKKRVGESYDDFDDESVIDPPRPSQPPQPARAVLDASDASRRSQQINPGARNVSAQRLDGEFEEAKHEVMKEVAPKQDWSGETPVQADRFDEAASAVRPAETVRPPRPTEAAPLPPPPPEPPLPEPLPASNAASDQPPKIPATLPNRAPPMPVPAPSPMPTRMSAAAMPPASAGPRVICDRCGTENASHVRFCASCGTTLAPSMLPIPAPELRPSAPNAASAPPVESVSAYAATVPQPQLAAPEGAFGAAQPFQSKRQKQAAPESMQAGQPMHMPEQQSSTRWLVIALLAVLVVAVVFILLMLW